MVRLTGYERRKPGQLSGGQRQRVALARALVNRPRVLLLDEPLGALDLKLREEMQIELKAIQQQVGITFIYVTHDQEEALTMSDRLAVFNRGRIEQVGAPADVYERPATAFVAGLRRDLEPAPRRRRPGDRRRGRHVHGPAGEDPARGARATASAPTRRRRSAASGASSTSAPDTRFVVALDAGSELVVTQQNLATSSMDALALEGKAVRLIWKRQHNYPVADAASVSAAPEPARMEEEHRCSSGRVLTAIAVAAVVVAACSGGATPSPSSPAGSAPAASQPAQHAAEPAPRRAAAASPSGADGRSGRREGALNLIAWAGLRRRRDRRRAGPGLRLGHPVRDRRPAARSRSRSASTRPTWSS